VRLRRIALALAVVACVLYLGVAIPAGSRLSAARAELLDAQRQRDARTASLSGQRRREAALLRAVRPVETATLMGVRREIVSTLDQAILAASRVDVRPGRAPAVAVVRVDARGAFADLMGLSQRLAEPGSGLADRVRLARSPAASPWKWKADLGRSRGARPGGEPGALVFSAVVFTTGAGRQAARGRRSRPSAQRRAGVLRRCRRCPGATSSSTPTSPPSLPRRNALGRGLGVPPSTGVVRSPMHAIRLVGFMRRAGGSGLPRRAGIGVRCCRWGAGGGYVLLGADGTPESRPGPRRRRAHARTGFLTGGGDRLARRNVRSRTPPRTHRLAASATTPPAEKARSSTTTSMRDLREARERVSCHRTRVAGSVLCENALRPACQLFGRPCPFARDPPALLCRFVDAPVATC
jgi:hypothetical protein